MYSLISTGVENCSIDMPFSEFFILLDKPSSFTLLSTLVSKFFKYEGRTPSF